MQPPHNPITILEVTDPQELAEAQRQRKQFDENAAWLQSHIPSIYTQHRGKFICVAGKELFVGDSAAEVIDQATTAHPDDQGWFTRYIPLKKTAGVYAN